LDYNNPNPNQQVRVDLIDPNVSLGSADPVLGSVTQQTGVLRNLFQTDSKSALTISKQIADGDLTAYAGKTIRLRIAAVNNRGLLIVGVDNVKLDVEYNDKTPPVLANLHVINPTFTDSSGVPHTSDPTLAGIIA